MSDLVQTITPSDVPTGSPVARAARRLFSRVVARSCGKVVVGTPPPVRRMFLRKLMWSSLAVALFMTPIVWTLAATVPNIRDTPLVPSDLPSGMPEYPIELYYTSPSDRPRTAGLHDATISLRLANGQTLIRHSELRLVLGTYDTHPQLVEGSVAIEGTPCVFRARPGTTLANNKPLAFVITPSCQLWDNGTGVLRVDLRYRGAGRIAIWTTALPHGSQPAADQIWTADSALPLSTPTALVQGSVIDYLAGPTYRRIDLLAYMWQVGSGVGWIWGILGCAAALALGGILAMPVESGAGLRSRYARLGGAAAGSFALMLGLALLYAVLVPPFQAPDETVHFLTFTSLTHRADARQDVERWVELTHFPEMRSPETRFRPSSVGHPSAEPWDDELIDNPEGRSKATVAYWRVLIAALPATRTTTLFLMLRSANATVFALACGAAAVILATCAGVQLATTAILGLLVIPTLPFFAMAVSNYAVLTSAYLLLAAGILGLMADGDNSHYSGFLIGVGASLAVAASHSALPLMICVAAVLAGRIFIGSRGTRSWRRAFPSAAVFWLGFSLGISSWHLVTSDSLAEYIVRESALVLRNTFPLDRLIGNLAKLPATGLDVLLAAMLGLIGAGLEVALAMARSGRTTWLTGRRVIRFVALTMATFLLSVLLASAIVSCPVINWPTASRGWSSIHYILSVLAVELTSGRISHPDVLLSQAFWGGFGWLNRFLPAGVTNVLSSCSAVLLAFLLIELAASDDVRRLGYLVFAGIGVFLSFALYAAAMSQTQDLHGRYLIGAYLILLSVIWSWPAVDRGVQNIRPAARRIFAVSVVCFAGSLHALALSFIVSSYF